MMGAESTRNMYSNFAVNNKEDCLKLHHVGYLINRAMMHGTTNIQFKDILFENECELYKSSGFLDYVFGGSFSLGLENPIVANLFKEFRRNNLSSLSGCGSPREMPSGQRLRHKRTPEPKK
jgi:hypothetical protein